MNTQKQVGIWMDHSTANIMKLSNGKITRVVLESTPAFPEQQQNLRMDESLMQNKKQNERSGFYEKLSNVINDCKEVVLFGPTNAKTELYNLLKGNRGFENVEITVQSADNMTDNQQEAFVKDFFDTP